MVSIITGCARNPRINPYAPAWQEFLSTLIEDGVIEDTSSVIYTDGDMADIPITIRISDNCPLSCIEVIDDYLLPSFADNNDLTSYAVYKCNWQGGWTIDISGNEELLRVSSRDGLNIDITSISNSTVFDSLSINLSDYRTANEDSGLSSGRTGRIYSLYDISGYVVGVDNVNNTYNSGYLWKNNNPILLYIDPACPSDEIDRIATEAYEVYTGRDLFFFYADTGERIWIRR